MSLRKFAAMPDHDNADFSVALHTVQRFASPGFHGLTLIQVLKGELIWSTQGQQTLLRTGHIRLINRHTDWTLSGNGDNAVMVITLSGQWVARYYSDFFRYDYRVPSEPGEGGDSPWRAALHHALRQVLIATVMKNEQRYWLEVNRWLSEAMLILVTGFQYPARDRGSREQRWSRRITQVVQRIEANANRRISLGEIARAEFVSEAWLSRLFKKEVGISFMRFITELRLKNALEALHTSSKPIHQIAMEQGFANNRQMIDLFRRHYGKTPGQMRQQPPDATRRRSATNASAEPDSVTAPSPALLFSLLNDGQNAPSPTAALHYDTSEELALTLNDAPRGRHQLRAREIVITVREIDDLRLQEVQEQLRALNQRFTLTAIDIHEPVLNSSLFREEAPGDYGWSAFQQIIQFVDELGIGLCLHFAGEASRERLEAFLNRCIDHFPSPVIGRWRFLWHCLPMAQHHEHAWRVISDAVRRRLPGSCLGIALPLPIDPRAVGESPLWQLPWLPEADFLACTADANALLTVNGDRETQIRASLDYPSRQLLAIGNALQRHKLSLPLHLLAWNTLTGQTLSTNGGFFRGALLMHSLLGLPDSVQSVGFWLNAALQRETLEGEQVDTTSLALFFSHSLPRPIYWVLHFWQRLQGERLTSGPHHLLTRHSGGYRLLLSNPQVFNPDLSSQQRFIQRFRKRLRLRLTGLPAGRWQVRQLRFDQQNGALFPLLEPHLTPRGPDRETLEWIRHRARPHHQSWEITLDGPWETHEALESNALVLYELSLLSPS
ncbi:helix-turn-helix domain-containing protein [Erwinia sp. CPCC 100877]|nr:helix-turn-helix domain-containing protein [Erwinia sp. CPCC 100877]